MKHIPQLLCFFAAVLLWPSCNRTKDPETFTGQDTTKKNIALVMGNPIDYGQKNLLIFPVGGNYNPDITKQEPKESDEDQKAPRSGSYDISTANNGSAMTANTTLKYDREASAEYANQFEEDFDIRNLLFYEQQTGESYLVALQNMHILSFSIHNDYKRKLIFYRVVKKDSNKDGKYNSKDAVMFCVSDIDGKNLIEVTPPDEKFLEYFYYSENQTLLVKTSFDIDKNGEFNAYDETNFREMKIMNPAPGKEIFAKSLKDSIKNILK